MPRLRAKDTLRKSEEVGEEEEERLSSATAKADTQCVTFKIKRCICASVREVSVSHLSLSRGTRLAYENDARAAKKVTKFNKLKSL